MLNGQKLQGPQTSAEVYKFLQKKDLVNKWVHVPLLNTFSSSSGSHNVTLSFSPAGFHCFPRSTTSALRAKR